MSTIRPLLIGGLVMTEVGLWQWRMVIAARGNRAGAVLLGAIGAVLQITALSQVVTNLNDPLSVAAYSGGVGVGVLLGLIAGDRLTSAMLGVTIITSESGVADELWARGWPATVHTSFGERGAIDVLHVAISRQNESRLHDDVSELAPNAMWSTDQLRGHGSDYQSRYPTNPLRHFRTRAEAEEPSHV